MGKGPNDGKHPIARDCYCDDCVFNRMSAHNGLLVSENIKLKAENNDLKEFIEGIYMNTSTSMPAAWNDENSWYQSQLNGVIGKAARFAKRWKT